MTPRTSLRIAALGFALACVPSLAAQHDDRVERAMQALRNRELDDDSQALATLRELAAAGDAVAQYNLGVLYLQGIAVTQDLPTAVEWWKKDADEGQVDAQYKLAHSYRVGRGIEPDAGKAFYWYARAAEQGDAEAQYNVAESYRVGYGTKPSLKAAVKWYEKAAEGGDVQARAALAMTYAMESYEGYSPALAYQWLLLVLPHLGLYAEGPRAEAEGLRRRLESMLDVDARARARAAADAWKQRHPKENLPKPLVEVSIEPRRR
jgi:hypothetical protein